MRRAGPAAPVRLVHLGLGSFFRAHAAVYTAATPGWGIAAFGGRSADLARRLTRQDGLYTLVVRGPVVDQFTEIDSVVAAYAGADHEQWLRHFAGPDLAAVTITVTEYGYRRRTGGGLDVDAADIQRDVNALRADTGALVATAPARLVAGLAAHHRAGRGPIAIVSCDNLPANGEAAREVVTEFARLVDPALADWIDTTVSFPSSMVDRITPRPEPGLAALVKAATGADDDCPVVTEPFSEWVLSGSFPAGRPPWEDAGVTFADDIEPHERRKLYLLNGAHSLLAYAGLARGHATVSDAIADPVCRALVEQWWDEARQFVGRPDPELRDYCARLITRWENPRIEHQLAQIAADGSQKLPVRVAPVLLANRRQGRLPAAAITTVAGWISYLCRFGADASDAALAEVLPLVDGPPAEIARRVLARLNPELGDDAELTAALASELT